MKHQPRERRLWSPQQAAALGLVPRLKRGDTEKVVERDAECDLVAFSSYHEVVLLTCHNRLRFAVRGLGPPGTDLPDLEIVRSYDKLVDAALYAQTFRVLMFSLRAVKPKEFDSKRVAWVKHKLFPLTALGYDRTEYRQRMGELFDWAFDHEATRRTVFAVAEPVESERFGKGRVLEAIEVSFAKGKGGLLERQPGIRDLVVRGKAAGHQDNDRRA